MDFQRGFFNAIWPTSNRFFLKGVLLACCISLSISLFGHGVQLTYCITEVGTVRVFIEHWHGNLGIAQMSNAEVQIIVNDGTTTTNQFYQAQGAAINTTIDNLPGCKDDVISLSGCTSRGDGQNQNTQNDWGYWDFVPPSCFEPLSVTVNSVRGSEAFIFAEGCNNLYPASFSTSFGDCAEPQIDCPGDIVTVAGADCTATVTGLDPIILFDDCTAEEDLILSYSISGATIRSGIGLADGSFNLGLSTVVLYAEDETGKIGQCILTVLVEDNTPPSIDCSVLSNMIGLTCALGPPPILSLADFSPDDNCTSFGDIAFTVTETVSSVETCPSGSGNITRLYTFTDEAGNMTSCGQRISFVDDIEAPTVVGLVPTDVNLDCDVSAPAVPSVEFVDNCTDPVNVEFFETFSPDPDCPSAYVLLRTWIASDDCGNETSITQTITVTDDTDPELDSISDLTIDCNDEAAGEIAAWLILPSSTDNCGSVTITHDWDGSIPDFCAGENITITFEATDLCGNITDAQAKIIGTLDSSGPIFLNCPSDITVNADFANCGSNIVFSTPLAEDCGEFVAVNYAAGSLTSGDVFPEGVSTVTFESADNCGNVSNCSFDITVIDDSTPTIHCPSNTVVVCSDSGGCTWTSDESINVSSADNCPDYVVTYTISGATIDMGTDNATNVDFELGTSTVTYTITDNTVMPPVSSSCMFDVVVEDCEAPVVSCIDDLDNVCGTEDLAQWLSDTEAAIIATGDIDSCSEPLTVTSKLIELEEPCGNTFVRTYLFMATDQAGNTGTCEATYSVVDTAPPLITDATDLTLECNGTGQSLAINTWIANNGNATLTTESCGDVTWTNNFTSLSDGCGTNGTAIVVFTASDRCGNNVTTSASVTLADTQSPTLVCAEDLVIECGDPNANASVASWLLSAQATDDCSNVTVTNDYIGLPDCGVSSMVTFTVSDNCDGVVVTCTASISVDDTTPPAILSPPVDLYVECDGSADPDGNISTWLLNSGGMIVSDACDTDPEITNEELTSTLICTGSEDRIYQFTVTDACGNLIASDNATVHIIDTTSPTVTMPNDVTVNCNGNPDPVAWSQTFTVLDDCDPSPMVIHHLDSIDENCDGQVGSTVYSYSFYAIDNCGNSQPLEMRTYTVEDSSAPTIVAPDDLLLDCTDNESIAVIAWLDDYMVSDNCSSDGELVVTNDFTGIPDMCGGSTLVTWEVTDACGGSSTASADIILSSDNTPPSITCPSDLTLVCNDPNNDALINSWLIQATGDDICSNVSMTNNYTSGLTLDCMSISGTIVTFTATDDCGNMVTCDATIILVDTNDPEFLMKPQDLIIECDGEGNEEEISTWVDNNGGGMAVDDCDADLEWSVSDSELENCGNTIVKTYTFTITDDCDNTISADAKAIIEDTTPPDLSVPADMIVTCDQAGNQDDIDDLLASVIAPDICSESVVITNTLLSVSSGCGGTTVSTYQIVATDDCGNEASDFFVFATTDTAIPAVTCPLDLALECGDPDNPTLIQAWLSSPIAPDDNCSEIIITNNFDGSLTDGCPASQVVIFTFMDECGNGATCSSNIIVNDTTPPAFVNCSDDLEVTLSTSNCDQQIIFSTPIATDNCDNLVDVTLTSDIPSGSQFPIGTSTVSFEAEDDCGRVATCEFDITVIDGGAPTISCPSNVVTCADIDGCSWTADSSTNPVTAGNCDGITVTYSIANADGSTTTSTNVTGVVTLADDGVVFDIGTSVATYTITDANGNSSSCNYNIVVEDCQAPEITCPVAGEAGGAMTTVVNGARGGCSQMTVSYSSTSGVPFPDFPMTVDLGGAVCNYDVSGNLISQSSGDTSCPISVTGGGTFNLTFTTDFDLGGGGSCPFATTITASELIMSSSTLTGSCGSEIPVTFVATATDNCPGDVTVTSSVINTISGCGNTNTQIIEYQAVDASGNVSTCTAEYQTVDENPPVINTPATNENSTCADELGDFQDWLMNNGGAVASDDCGSVTWSYNITNVDNSDCSGVSTIDVTFIASDDCGNSSTTDATFSGEDGSTPSITCPENITLNCGDANNDAIITNWLASAQATDDCSVVSVTHDFVTLSTNGCNGTGVTTVTFTAMDDCENTSTCTASITIQDNQTPVFDLLPQDLVVECDGAGNMADINAWLLINGNGTATDICDPSPSWTNTASTPVQLCVGSTRTTYTFTVSDDCGNEATVTANVIIQDSTPPSLTAPATATTVECDGTGNIAGLTTWLNNEGNVTGTDICGAVTITESLINTISGCGDGVELVYQFSGSDDCGNIAQVTSTFIILDSTAPSLTCPPNLILECGNDSNDQLTNAWLISPTISDDCGFVQLTNDFNGSLPTCGGSMMVEFTATDECGITTTCSASVTVNDSAPPVFVNCPTGSLTVFTNTVDCGNNVIFSNPVAQDACDDIVLVTQLTGPSSGTAISVGTYPMSFMATDECDNSALCNFTLIVEDNTAPSLECPDGPITVCAETVNCQWSSADIGPVTASDNCPGVTFDYSITGATTATGNGDASGTMFNIGVSYVTYSILDTDNNGGTCTFIVIVEDCEAPVIECPAEMTVLCDGMGNTTDLSAWLAPVVATDNCLDSPNVLATLFNTTSGCGSAITQTYEFYSVDDFGNESVCYADFIIEDTAPPVINTPPTNESVVCNGTDNSIDLNTWLSNSGGAVATDLCGSVTWSNDFDGTIVSTCAGTGVYTVTFTATDDCSNSIDAVAKFTITDTVLPVIDCPTDITLGCSDVNNTAIITNWLNGATATDVCSAVSLTNDFTALSTLDCGDTGETTVTFTAVDACGIIATCTAMVIIEDNDNPIISTLPSDITLECDDPMIDAMITAWLANNGGAIGSDDCDSSPIWTRDIIDNTIDCGDAGTTTYLFTLTDECDNFTSASANVIIEDTTPPTLFVPDDMLVDCDGEGNEIALQDWIDSATTETDCGATPSINARLDNTISDCGLVNEMVYLFTATDACGNSSTDTASFTIQDNTPPVIDCPPVDLVLECGDPGGPSAILLWLNSVSATDECSATIITNNYPLDFIADCGDTGSTEVEFIATDVCGNTSTCTAMIIVSDNGLPTITCPEDLILSCNNPNNDILITTWLTLATGDDDCSDVTITNNYNSGLTIDCSSAMGSVVTFTATDECGNLATCTASIILDDNDLPIITTFPDDLTLECNAPTNGDAIDAWILANGGAVAIDDCDVNLTWTLVAGSEVMTCGSSTIMPYTFTVSDDCGNTAIARANIELTDTTDPVLTPPELTTVECDGLGNQGELAAWLATAEVEDTCDENIVVIATLDNTISGCGLSQTLVYLFTATDACGNSVSTQSSFVISDGSPPVITCPEDPLVLECGNPNNLILVSGWLSEVSGTDDCSGTTITNDFVGLPTDLLCNEGGSMTVTFTSRDACGNSSTCTGMITINDTTPPEFDLCPIDVTLSTDDGCGNTPIFSFPPASDACGVTVTQTDGPSSGTEFVLGTTTVEFTATDACGLTDVCSWNITVVDIDSPEIACPIGNTMKCVDAGECEWVSDSTVAPNTSVENCPGLTITYEITGTTMSSGEDDATEEIFNLGTSTVTYTITDGSGNNSTCSFDVVVEDCEDPEITTCVEDLTVGCNDPMAITVSEWQSTLVAEDNCDDSVDVTALLFNTISGCGMTMSETYLFTVTDTGGNTSTCLATYTIEDKTPPTIECPETLVLECGDPNNPLIISSWLATAVATDGCDIPSLSNNFKNLPTDLLCNDGGGSVDVVFTAEDGCDNVTTCTAMITINDTTTPTFEMCPADITLNADEGCGSTPIFSAPIASDNCEVTVTQTDGLMSGQVFPLGTSTIEYTATDGCGNTAICTWDIIVQDITDPVVLCPSVDVVQCADIGTCMWVSDTSVSPSFSTEDCPDFTMTYVITGATVGMGSDDASGEIFELGTSTVTYTMTDGSNNTTRCTFDVVIGDCEAPILTCPMETRVECGDPLAMTITEWHGTATSLEYCDDEVVITTTIFNSISGCGDSQSEVYLFTATDMAGNVSTCISSYTIQDTTAPEIDCPEPLSIECGDSNTATLIGNWLSSITATDDCSTPVITHNYVAPPQGYTCNESGVISVVFVATDACGLITTCTSEIMINDTQAPTITCPSNLTLECNNVNNPTLINVWLASATGNDTCGAISVTNDFGEMLALDCSGANGTVVTFTASDNCDNTVTCTASIFLEDDDLPTITTQPKDLFLECDGQGNTTEVGVWLMNNTVNDATFGLEAVDNCGDVTITYTEGIDISGCSNESVTTYTFTVTDICGNAISVNANVHIEDSTDPILTLPIEIASVNCDTDIESAFAAWLDSASASDNCGLAEPLAVLFQEVEVCDGTNTVTRRTYTFTATDDCNNSVSETATFTVIDDVDPVIVAPAPLMLMCGDNFAEQVTAWLDDYTVIDACQETIVTNDFSGAVPDACIATTITVTWTISDGCGATASISSDIIVEEDVPPTITSEAQDLTVECDGTNQSILLQGWLGSRGGAEATDDCSDQITWTNNFTNASIETVCTGTTNIPVTFTAIDQCGTVATTQATFRIEDSTPPVMRLPDNLTLDCGDPFNTFYVLSWINDATAVDGCSGFIFVQNDSPGVLEETCGETITQTITFTASDQCGNDVSDTRIVTTIDRTPPVIITEAQDIVLECGSEESIQEWLGSHGGAVAIDNCSDDDLVWTYSAGDVNPTCGSAGEQEFIFAVTDNCGNTSTSVASLITNDSTLPELVVPTDLVQECSDQFIDVETWAENATGTDNCGDVQITYILWDSNLGCGNTTFTRYQFTATDACGNAVSEFADYRTFDTTPPVVTCPSDLSLECGNPTNSIILSNWINSATAVDAFDCSEVSVTGQIPAGLPDLSCDGVDGVEVTFTAVDDCGNISLCTANVYVVDSIDPVFVNCPVDMTVNVDVDLCGANPIFSTPIATDDCAVTVSQTLGHQSGTEFPLGDTFIEFTAVDACGNTSTCSFIITIADTDVPLVLCPSNAITVETSLGLCEWIADDRVGPSLSLENCPEKVLTYVITGATMVSGNDSAEGEALNFGENEICYTITDSSNNASTCCFDVIVEDHEVPKIDCPSDEELIANEQQGDICVIDYSFVVPTATDNCGISKIEYHYTAPDGVETSISNVTAGSTLTQLLVAGISTIEYTVIDLSGNVNTCSYILEVIGIKHEKSITRVTHNPDDTYCTEYNITVTNTGNNAGAYHLVDLPDFDNDFVIISAEYSSSVHVNTVLTTTPPIDGWILATNQLIPGFGVHIYTLSVCTEVDFVDPMTPGDGIYTLCGSNQDPSSDLDEGQGLFNQSIIDVNSDGIPDAHDTVCVDIPFVTHHKEYIGASQNDDGTYDVQFKITVDNIGGDVGSYDLVDQPFFDDDFVIHTSNYQTDIANGGAGFIGGNLVGLGPWILTEDQSIGVGETQCYTLTVNVSINLSDPDTVGDERYLKCGSSINPDGSNQRGQGLYNESSLDRSNDGTPDEIDSACGDIDIVDLALTKLLFTPPSYTYGQILDFNIVVTNQGNIDLYNIEVNDYLPTGFDFASVTTNDPKWSMVSAGLLLYDAIPGPLVPGGSVTIPLQLALQQGAGGIYDWDNYAELGYYEDENSIDQSDNDIDSTPDNNASNDNPVVVGDSDDNSISQGGPLVGEDEDDHDPAGPDIFDLALRKTSDLANSELVNGGDAFFNIEIFNQGNVEATNIVIVDYLPCGYTFNSTSSVNAGWLYSLQNNQITKTLTTPLAPGSSVVVPLLLALQPCGDPNAYLNIAEIFNADDTDPLTIGLPVDIDSSSDNDPTDDILLDNEISDIGVIDEDDHDVEELDVDIPLYASLGNYVWLDQDVDGIQDPNEPGISGVTVILYNSNGNVVTSTITDANGFYLFDNLDPGDYYVQFVAPNGLVLTSPNQGVNDVLDSDVTGVFGIGTTSLVTLNSGDNNLTVDAGYYSCVLIGDIVWYDSNANGIYDTYENGVNGVLVEVVQVTNSGNQVIASQYTGHEPGTSSNDGYWKLCVPAGEYFIRYIVPEGLNATIPNVGYDESIDSDVTHTNGPGTTDMMTIVTGGDHCNIGAGFLSSTSISGTVWLDEDMQGDKDDSETIVAGITVEVYDCEGVLLGTTVTDAQGNYIVSGLDPIEVYVRFVLPAGFAQTISNAHPEHVDSDIDNTFGFNTTDKYQLIEHMNVPNVDGGIIGSSVLEAVFIDLEVSRNHHMNILSWSVPNDLDITHYEIQRRIENEEFSKIAGVLSAQNQDVTYSLTDYDSASSAHYYYRIVGFKDYADNVLSNIVSINVEEDQRVPMKVYPIPAISKVTVELFIANSDRAVSYNLYNSSGNKIVSNYIVSRSPAIGDYRFAIKIDDYPGGVYNLEVFADGQIQSSQIIIVD